MWEGVVCNNLTGHVLQLHLQRSGLQGKLNPCLLNLKHLRYIDLSLNLFSNESIPNFIGSFANLEYLDLSDAGFYGTIPQTLGNLSSLRTLRLEAIYPVDINIEWLSGLSHLEHLDMSYVNLSRATNWLQVINKLPSLVELNLRGCSLENNNFMAPDLDEVNFTSLTNLDLSGNKLGPVVPRWIFQLNKLTHLYLIDNLFEGSTPSISNTTKLQYIDLSFNNFNSTIPDWIYTCKSLQSLNIEGNLLLGPIPISLGKLSSLTHLRLGFNKFTGNLPYSFGQLYNLTFLSIQSNMLEGIVSESHFANLTKLKILLASGNHLTLQVEPNWIPPFKLSVLGLGSWNLGGDHNRIPTWLETQKGYISDLDLSNTGISFHVPSWFWEMTGYLNLSRNQLHGNIPADVIIGASFIDLSSNLFNGSLPRLANGVIKLDLSNNSFSGGISHSLCDTATNETYWLQILHVGGNLLSGELPADDDCWIKWNQLAYLNIGSNNMSGSIPNSIGLLPILQSLNLYNNSLSGQIPSSIQNCTNLLKIDISNNKLVGRIPSLMGISLSQLRILILRSNKLSGEIPTGICQLSFLQILDLSDNIFSGKIPRCISNFTPMATKRWFGVMLDNGVIGNSFQYSYDFLDSASVATKGIELHYDTILYLVTNIDLSRNNLSGEIPKEITSLAELRSLNLSQNHFTGLIPYGIGDMKQLESLDLSRNSLSGEIPNSITVLSSLNYMNLSYNNLMGRIPESTQLRSLNESSFIGNKLCGPPLTSGCSNDKGHAPGFYYYKEDGGKKWEIDWFYIFLTLGYVVGFSAVCNALIFIKSWRQGRT
ncbi:hypothetical protein RD792_006516 [Penstemon davidsonii]|uniref:Uncharacterized protein n=1 Tax=Penstemon davidsonii TaxID=160366 RepID=A0ABR0DD89_9LAMI|nr:hypothetical protein RD792_006516 [Penstemon davidsonii]